MFPAIMNTVMIRRNLNGEVSILQIAAVHVDVVLKAVSEC